MYITQADVSKEFMHNYITHVLMVLLVLLVAEVTQFRLVAKVIQFRVRWPIIHKQEA
jgi:hypothetical protein